MPPTPELRSERLILRAWREDDCEPFAAMNADLRVMEYTPKTLTRKESDELVGLLRSHFDRNGFGMWAIEVVDGAPFIGFVGLNIPTFEAPFTPCVEIGWRLAHAHWGKGYASEAARTALTFAFQTLNLSEVLAWTVPSNLRSRKVMDALGFKHSAADDFDHPRLAEGHPLRRHVLYRLPRPRNVI